MVKVCREKKAREKGRLGREKGRPDREKGRLGRQYSYTIGLHRSQGARERKHRQES